MAWRWARFCRLAARAFAQQALHAGTPGGAAALMGLVACQAQGGQLFEHAAPALGGLPAHEAAFLLVREAFDGVVAQRLAQPRAGGQGTLGLFGAQGGKLGLLLLQLALQCLQLGRSLLAGAPLDFDEVGPYRTPSRRALGHGDVFGGVYGQVVVGARLAGCAIRPIAQIWCPTEAARQFWRAGSLRPQPDRAAQLGP